MRPEESAAFKQGFDHAQFILQQSERQQNIQVVMQEPARQETRRVFPFGRAALATIAVSTAALALLDGAFDAESVTSGTASTFLDARSIEAVTIWSGQKIITGSADHEVTGPVTNPWAESIAVVERNVEYIPTGSIELRAVNDEELGFYIFITESKNGRDIPFDFTNVRVVSPKPEPCPIEVINNEIRPKDYCTPVTSKQSRGIISTTAWQGAPLQNDTSITLDARYAMNVAKNNTYCELGVVFGSDSLANAINETVVSVSSAQVYEGVRSAGKAVFRTQVSLQYNVPLTNAQGMPYVLWEDDIEVLKKIAKEQKKPISSFTADELRSLLQLENALLEQNNEIDPGPLYAEEILAAREKNEDINLPSSTPELKQETAQTNGWNYSCLPDPNTEQAKAMIEDQARRLKIGMLGNLPPFATAKGDGSFYTATEAQALLEQFLLYVGVS